MIEFGPESRSDPENVRPRSGAKTRPLQAPGPVWRNSRKSWVPIRLAVPPARAFCCARALAQTTVPQTLLPQFAMRTWTEFFGLCQIPLGLGPAAPAVTAVMASDRQAATANRFRIEYTPGAGMSDESPGSGELGSAGAGFNRGRRRRTGRQGRSGILARR